MNKKFWIALLIIIVGVFGLAITQSNKDSAIKRKVENPKAVQADDHIRGKSDSKVYLITYGDYECPACNAWEPEIQKIKDEYKDRVAFIFRNLPLTDKHINAFAAARAAEAANLQAKFWEMHDLLYVKWEEWNGDNKSAQAKFETYAQELGLDMTKFKTDYQSEVVADRINSDLVTASAVGADGTPTFLINGEKIKVDAVSSGKTEIRRLLDQKLSAQ